MTDELAQAEADAAEALVVASEDHVHGAGDVFAFGELVELDGIDRRLLEAGVL